MTVSAIKRHRISAGDNAIVDLQHVQGTDKRQNIDKEAEKDCGQETGPRRPESFRNQIGILYRVDAFGRITGHSPTPSKILDSVSS